MAAADGRLAARLETWVWILIYGGLFAGGLGYALLRQGAAWGAALVALGAVAVVAGGVGIWFRSRLRDPAPAAPPTPTKGTP